MKKIILYTALSLSALFAQVKTEIQVPYMPYEIKLGKGFDTVQANCLMCHSFGYITNQGPQSRKFWEEKTIKMIDAFKSPMSKEDIKTVVDYLFEHYGNGKEE